MEVNDQMDLHRGNVSSALLYLFIFLRLNRKGKLSEISRWSRWEQSDPGRVGAEAESQQLVVLLD